MEVTETLQALGALTIALMIVFGVIMGLVVSWVIHTANAVVKSVQHGRQVVTTWSGR